MLKRCFLIGAQIEPQFRPNEQVRTCVYVTYHPASFDPQSVISVISFQKLTGITSHFVALT